MKDRLEFCTIIHSDKFDIGETMGKLEIKYITKEMPLLIDKKAGKKAKNKEQEHLWVLRGVSLNINDGEAIGIVGSNGSGKSALLRIIAGKEEQTTGFITSRAKITYAGTQDALDPELTGLENIRQAILKSEIDDFKGDHITNAILNFTELGEWIYSPVKIYSTAQYARLSIGIAMFLEPDIVLLDNVFGILDQPFYLKTSNKVQELKDKGVSFLIADTKSIVVEGFCERTLWLQYGEVQDFGPTQSVVQQYNYSLDWYNALSLPEKNDFIAKKQREQMEFNIDSVYEEFKIEQFKHGYTRKDEPRMRKAFFVDKGVDPVYQDQMEKQSKPKKKKKRKWPWVILVLLLLVGIVFGAGYVLSSHKSNSTKKSVTSSLVMSTKKSEPAKISSSAKSQISSQKSSSVSSSTEQTQTITVQDGEAISNIAEKYQTTVKKIQELNNLGSSTDVKQGETLKVPK